MSDARRPRRVAETLRKHVAEGLMRDVFDPRLQGLIVTRVELGSDLSVAHVYIRSMKGDAQPERQVDIERAAAGLAPRLRRGLNAKLGLRRVPELRMHYDRNQDALDRIESILHEIQRDSASEAPLAEREDASAQSRGAGDGSGLPEPSASETDPGSGDKLGR